MAHIDLTDANFDEKVIEASKDKLVIVDFWASWCMPCLMLGPVLDKIAEENKDKVVLAKLNVDENPQNAKKYGIMSIPAVKLFKDGEIKDEFTGSLPETAVKEWLDKNM